MSTHVTVIILSVVLILMVLYVSVQHTGEYTRDWYCIFFYSFVQLTSKFIHYWYILLSNTRMSTWRTVHSIGLYILMWPPSHIRVQKNVSPKQGTTSLTGGWPLVVQNPEPHFTWRSNHQEGRVSIPPIDNIFASTEPEPGFPTSYVFIWCSMIWGERWLFGLMELLTTTV